MFSQPSPPAFVPPPAPAAPQPMTQPTGGKPMRSAQQPTFISEAMAPPAAALGMPSLIGGSQAA